MSDPEELCARAAEMAGEDPESAYGMFQEAASAGHPNGIFGMAEMKMSGRGTERDPEGAERLYEVAADAGHPPSMYRLGMLWAGAMEHPEDPSRAADWFRRAAEAGFPPAYPEIAGILLYGYGTEADPAGALGWYRRAADAGDPLSMFKAGYMMSEGIGCERDEAEAIRMFRMSAASGVPEAMLKMSELCSSGKAEGGKAAAYNWCRSAADAGFVPARMRLATMLYQGEGVARDLPAAFGMYQSLMDEDPDAMFMVGRMVFEGLGTEKDEVRGFELLSRAAAAGSQIALQLVQDIRRRQNSQLIRIDGT